MALNGGMFFVLNNIYACIYTYIYIVLNTRILDINNDMGTWACTEPKFFPNCAHSNRVYTLNGKYKWTLCTFLSFSFHFPLVSAVKLTLN